MHKASLIAIARLRGLGSDERGIAIIAALGIMVVLSMTTVSVMAYAASNERHAARSTNDQVALALAEAGVNNAAARIGSAEDPLSASLLTPSVSATCPDAASTCQVDAYDTGDAVWMGTLRTDTTPNRWDLVSWGVVDLPTGGQVVRRLAAQVDVVQTTLENPNAASWNYVYSTRENDPDGCDFEISGTQVAVNVPVYAKGNLCITGTQAKIVETDGGQPVTVTVEGKLVYVGEQSKVGESAVDPITSGGVAGGCARTTTETPTPCTTTNWPTRWYVGETTAVQPINPPTMDDEDWQYWYDNAKPGPTTACAASSSPPALAASVFDNDTTWNASKTAIFDLTGSSSYRCRVYSGSTIIGELSWDVSSKTLTVAGTIFIDGAVTSSNDDARYDGKATIYANTFAMTGVKDQLCAVYTSGACDYGAWDPNEEMLIIVAGGAGSGDAITLSGTKVHFQGALFTDPDENVLLTGTQVELEGPVIGGGFNWGTQAVIKPLPVITDLPPGAPLTDNVHVEPAPPRYVGG